ncbi:MAG: cyclase [Actinobacteria bacterium]|nr:MAG: cyclase [Actinomycetota bacterium]
MPTISAQIDVAVPVRTAYNQWTQFEEFPQFMEGVAEVRRLNDKFTHWTTGIGGLTREFDAEIVELIPEKRVAWEARGGVNQKGTVSFDPIDDNHTRVTAEIDYEPTGFVEMAGEKLGFVERRVKDDLKRFKRFIENRDKSRNTNGVPDTGSEHI